jgi:hypothetical protein
MQCVTVLHTVHVVEKWMKHTKKKSMACEENYFEKESVPKPEVQNSVCRLVTLQMHLVSSDFFIFLPLWPSCFCFCCTVNYINEILPCQVILPVFKNITYKILNVKSGLHLFL